MSLTLKELATVEQAVANTFGVIVVFRDLGQHCRAYDGLTERDESSGLDHTWWRKYENQSGRWTSPDPVRGIINAPQSFNAYMYAANDPVNFVDPTGLDPQDPTRPPTTDHIDPDSGQTVPVSGIDAGVVTITAENSGLGMFGGDANQRVAVIDRALLNQGGGAQYPCTFNITITGLSGQALIDAQNEIRRIFATGSSLINVTFNSTSSFSQNSNSTNLNIVSEFRGEAANAIVRQGGGSPSNTGILGVTPTVGNNSFVNQSNISIVTGKLKGPGATLGTMIGRIGAHELIQHRLLGIGQEGPTKDITSSRVTPEELRTLVTSRFNLNPLNASTLTQRCRR